MSHVGPHLSTVHDAPADDTQARQPLANMASKAHSRRQMTSRSAIWWPTHRRRQPDS